MDIALIFTILAVIVNPAIYNNDDDDVAAMSSSSITTVSFPTTSITLDQTFSKLTQKGYNDKDLRDCFTLKTEPLIIMTMYLGWGNCYKIASELVDLGWFLQHVTTDYRMEGEERFYFVKYQDVK